MEPDQIANDQGETSTVKIVKSTLRYQCKVR